MSTIPGLPLDARLLQGDSHRGGGNRVYLLGTGDQARLLKVYRRRRDLWRAPFRALGHRLEGKRGTTAEARCETERTSLALWARYGFDVPALLDRPLPSGIAPPALWMEYCPGVTLERAIRARERTTEAVVVPLARFAGDLARRHAIAEREHEPLLVHEHPSLGHLMVFGERLVSFDLEGGYRPGFPVPIAIGFELAGLARTLLRARAPDAEALFDAFARGYGPGLRPRVEAALGSGRPRAVATRMRGQLRRRFLGKITKQDGLHALLAATGRAS